MSTPAKSSQFQWVGSKSDPTIETLFAKHKLHRLVLFSELKQNLLSEIDQAENGFYGKFRFSHPRKVGDGIRVGLEITPAFLQWIYEQLFRPRRATMT